MGKIVFNLGKTLDDLKITKNKLAVESKVRPATIAQLVNGESRRIELDTLTNILDALNRFDPNIGIKNIIEYQKSDQN